MQSRFSLVCAIALYVGTLNISLAQSTNYSFVSEGKLTMPMNIDDSVREAVLPANVTGTTVADALSFLSSETGVPITIDPMTHGNKKIYVDIRGEPILQAIKSILSASSNYQYIIDAKRDSQGSHQEINIYILISAEARNIVEKHNLMHNEQLAAKYQELPDHIYPSQGMSLEQFLSFYDILLGDHMRELSRFGGK